MREDGCFLGCRNPLHEPWRTVEEPVLISHHPQALAHREQLPRPDFLLRPGELLAVCEGLRVVAYEDGFLPDPARFIQRIVAVREIPGSKARQTLT